MIFLRDYMSCGKRWKFNKKHWKVPRIPNYAYWIDLRHLYWGYVRAHEHKITYEKKQELWNDIVIPREKACNEKVDKIFAVSDRHGLNDKVYYSYRIKDLNREVAGKDSDDLMKEVLRKCRLG